MGDKRLDSPTNQSDNRLEGIKSALLCAVDLPNRMGHHEKTSGITKN